MKTFRLVFKKEKSAPSKIMYIKSEKYSTARGLIQQKKDKILKLTKVDTTKGGDIYIDAIDGIPVGTTCEVHFL